jgi:hypothetical protein
MKRNSNYGNCIAKKRRYNDSDENINTWDAFNTIPKSVDGSLVHPHNIKNYIHNDPVLDWYILYDKSYCKQIDKFEQLVFDHGNTFELLIFRHLKNTFGDDVVYITDNVNDINRSSYEKTIDCIFKEIPIIIHGVLFNDKNNTSGVPDIIIRSDYINKILNNDRVDTCIESMKASKLNGNYHYCIVDIKWTTLELTANCDGIINKDVSRFYKSQCAIYNASLGLIQGYTPFQSYILARAYKYTKKKTTYLITNAFDSIGIIDYDANDNIHIDNTYQAINWYRDVSNNGIGWDIDNPTRYELFPNMCNYSVSNILSNIRKKHAIKIKEITLLWRVGVKNRDVAFSHRIYTFDKCTSKKIGINGEVVSDVINKFIKINNSDKKIYPSVIINNTSNWLTETKHDYYIDYETINDCLFDNNINIFDAKNNETIIFMIGVWSNQNGVYTYKNFTMDRYTRSEEKRILDEFIKYITIYTKHPRLFYWNHVERTHLIDANDRHNYEWSHIIKKFVWIDMLTIFRMEPIIVNGMFSFSLKDVARNMHKLGMIKSCWNDNMADGCDAMIDAIYHYKNKHTDANIMNTIIKYNEIDCRVVQEIVQYLRINNV